VRLALAIAVALASGTAAEAGPCVEAGACASYEYPALADDTVLPPRPTVAINVKDMIVAGEQQKDTANPLPVIAKIDGKRVPITVTDVHSRGGLIRFIRVNSRRKGILQILGKLWRYAPDIEVIGTYRIAGAPKAAAPTLTSERAMGPRHGRTSAELEIDAAAIAFTFTWRRDETDPWHTEILEAASDGDGHSMTFVDEALCGDGCLASGIEATLSARLTNGRSVAIEVPKPLILTDKH
jgi:hypothetical protein